MRDDFSALPDIMRPHPFLALLWLHTRVLRQNQSACLILVFLIVAGVLLGRQPEHEVENTCYVLYWCEDDWVNHLRSSLPADCAMQIEIAPACQFTNEHGLISYPIGAHSIQMRTVGMESESPLIWYWYSGDQPEAMQPAVEWFWKTTREFRGVPVPEVRVSALEPINPFSKSTKIATRRLLNRKYARQFLLVSALFFCSAYLPALFIAEQTSGRLLDMIATKPIGLRGWGCAVLLFHGCLSLAVVLPMLWSFEWITDVRTWMAIVLLIAAYSGLAFTIGCCCRSVSSASNAVAVYGILSSVFITSSLFVELPTPIGSLEWCVVDSLVNLNSLSTSNTWMTVSGWTVAWCAIGLIAFRRLSR